MKLTVGQKYKLTFENGATVVCLYTGFENFSCYCDHCDKSLRKAHIFIEYGVKDGDCYHYGIECVKKIKIEKC